MSQYKLVVVVKGEETGFYSMKPAVVLFQEHTFVG